VAEVLADPETPEDVRHQLETIQRARSYARTLGLDVDQQYTSYVDWPGDRLVTTLVATRPGEVTPSGFWFPILGRLPYKGYFDTARAEAEAEKLHRDGFDVCTVPVPAYSTLGWIDDPITAPMLRGGEENTVETIFHELVHATIYVSDHADFNETVASFIGQEASIRFYEDTPAPESARARRLAVADDRILTSSLIAFRRKVEALYRDHEAGPERDATRIELEAQARTAIAALPLRESDAGELSERLALNDACLALIGTYGTDLDRYVAKLATLDGDLTAFIEALRSVSDAHDPAETLLGD